MKRTIIAVTLSIFTCPIANAEINVVQVPAACGTIAEVRDFLSRYVENRQTVGIGGNSGNWLIKMRDQSDKPSADRIGTFIRLWRL